MRLLFNIIRSLVRFFFELQIGIFFEMGKEEDIFDWEWGLYSGPGDREKRP